MPSGSWWISDASGGGVENTKIFVVAMLVGGVAPPEPSGGGMGKRGSLDWKGGGGRRGKGRERERGPTWCQRRHQRGVVWQLGVVTAAGVVTRGMPKTDKEDDRIDFAFSFSTNIRHGDTLSIECYGDSALLLSASYSLFIRLECSGC